MTLRERIDADLKDAMRSRDQVSLDTLRHVKTHMQLKETEVAGAPPCDDVAIIRIIHTLTKQRKESIVQFEQGGRVDLAEKERRELQLLEQYLPQTMPEAELAALVDAVIASEGATGAKDMGRVMKGVLATCAGRADGKIVSELVKKKLSMLFRCS